MNEELTRAQYRQLDWLQALCAQGDAIGGWKLGLTSGASRDAFGPRIRPFGFILASRMLSDGDTLDWSAVETGGIENEVCFIIDSDVNEPVTPQSVREHLASVAPAFEINQRRIDRTAPAPERIADDMANWGIVVGDPVPIPANWDQSALTITLRHEDTTVATVSADGDIDDHFETLARLANQLLEFGQRLEAGQRVITGAFGRQDQPEAGLWTGDFGPELGRVSLVVRR
jgi:2-oxo-hept-3-ene-1,7-dioate hydratase